MKDDVIAFLKEFYGWTSDDIFVCIESYYEYNFSVRQYSAFMDGPTPETSSTIFAVWQTHFFTSTGNSIRCHRNIYDVIDDLHCIYRQQYGTCITKFSEEAQTQIFSLLFNSNIPIRFLKYKNKLCRSRGFMSKDFAQLVVDHSLKQMFNIENPRKEDNNG